MEQPARRAARGGLEARGVSKQFLNVFALQGVSIAIRPGQVVGLAGHNGAGKSTLLRVLSGVIQPDAGSIAIDGASVELRSPAAALTHGIATVHQELSLLPNLTVTQNVFLAREQTRFGLLSRRSMRAEAEALVQRFGLDLDVERSVDSYPVATRQLLELAIATHRNVKYLLLDEPTTSLEGAQVERLLATIRALAREQGVGILFINHKLDELDSVADHMVALVDGQVRINRPATEVARADVVRAIAGEEALAYSHEADAQRRLAHVAAPMAPADALDESQVTLQARHLATATLRDVNLKARGGRVLGLYGLVGSGRTEFLRALIGVERITAGELSLFGKPYRPHSPAQARRHGIVYLTEERKHDGIIAPLDSVVNVTLPVLSQFQQAGLLNRAAMQRRAYAYLDSLKVRGDRSQPVQRLSGGNQQKVLLARALAQEPRVLLLDEPTKGVDIGVKIDIHQMIRSLAREAGLTVILVSSEEEEILDVADDVAVFVQGACDGHVERAADLSATRLRRIAWPHA